MFIVITAALFVSPSCCRWSFHWQSLLPATDHRPFYHSPGSPGSLLWLLEAAGCFGSSLLPVVHKRDTCFFFRPSERAIFLHRWRTHRSKTVFGLEDVVSPTDREAQSSSLCFLFLSRPRFISSEGSNFTQSNTRILRETFGCDCASMARTFGLSYSNTPELLSSSLLYLRRCECPIGVWPDTALQ